MSRTEWPQLCSIADAARLFAAENVKVDRSNLSRFIVSRAIPTTQRGRDRLVDPNVLFDRYTKDFSRSVMAGQGGTPLAPLTPAPPLPPPPAQAAPTAPPAYDPKRHVAELNAQKLELELAEQLGRTVTAEEAAAAMAEAIAELRAAFARKARDEAARALTELGLGGHMKGVLVAAFKRFATHGQEAFAAKAAELLEASSTPDAPARARLDRLVAYDLVLRGEAEEDAAEREPALDT